MKEEYGDQKNVTIKRYKLLNYTYNRENKNKV